MEARNRWIWPLIMAVVGGGTAVLFPTPELHVPHPTAPAPSAREAELFAPRWWKGNTHTHTLWSDGDDFPENVVHWYASRDYDFLVLSDHNILSRGEKWMKAAEIEKRGGAGIFAKLEALVGAKAVHRRERDGVVEYRLATLEELRRRFDRKGEFLLIEGEELTARAGRFPVHINVLNLEEVLKPVEGASVVDVLRKNFQLIDAAEAKAGRPHFAHLNHPNFGWAITAEEMAEVREMRSFEVFNGHPDINHLGNAERASDEMLWDIANSLRLAKEDHPPLFGFATDDAHNWHGPKGSTPGRGFIYVRAKELSEKALLTALKQGDFYASSGVELTEVAYDPKTRTLKVEVQPEPGASYRIRFIGTKRGTSLAGAPVLNDNGAQIRTTLRYNQGVGAILAESEGTSASYTLQGDELYVRCAIISDRPHPNPVYAGQVTAAWTQPVRP